MRFQFRYILACYPGPSHNHCSGPGLFAILILSVIATFVAPRSATAQRPQTSDRFLPPRVAPLPPPRPQELQATGQESEPLEPAPISAPETTQSIPPKPAAVAPAPEHPITEPGGLVKHRVALRRCLLEWQDVRKRKQDQSLTWRVFSRQCIERGR